MGRPVGLCVLGIALVSMAVVGSLRSETEKAEGLDELAAARVKVAEGALEKIELRSRITAPALEEGREMKSLIAWSQRLMEAKLDLSNTTAERAAAVQAHMDRLAKSREMMQELHAIGRTASGDELDLIEYSLLEAKGLLIKVQATAR